jgi:hypothetical protein
MKILSRPDSKGYWWWRKDSDSEWEMSKVDIEPSFFAQFFDGDHFNHRSALHGEWTKATVGNPKD